MPKNPTRKWVSGKTPKENNIKGYRGGRWPSRGGIGKWWSPIENHREKKEEEESKKRIYMLEKGNTKEEAAARRNDETLIK